MEYNPQALKQYYNTRNYQGAIDYLDKFNFEGEDAILVRNTITDLKRSKAIQDSLQSSLSGEDSEAYNFIAGLEAGYIDRNRQGIYADGTPFETRNQYGTDYQKYINNLATKDYTPIKALSIDIDNKEALDKLQNELGINDFNKDLGAKLYSIADGKYRITIGTDNSNLYKFQNAIEELNKVGLDSAAIGGTIGFGVGGAAALATSYFSGGTLSWLTPMLLKGGTALGTAAGTAIDYWTSDYHIKGIGADKKYYDGSEFNVDNLKKAVDLVNDTKKKYDEINSRIGSTDTPSEISISGFMTPGQEKAFNDFTNGKISKAYYEEVTKQVNNYMINQISGMTFADKKVYAFGNEDGQIEDGKIQEGVMLNEVKNTDAENIKNEILFALSEDRLKFQFGTKDGKVGTFFTITAKKDKDNISDSYGNRQLYVFIEGFSDGTEKNYFENDSKAKAAKINADMKKIGYSMELSNFDNVGYEQGVPYRKQYNNQIKQYEKIPITESEILQSLNESAIIDQTTNYILKNLNPLTGLLEIETNNGTQELTIEDFLKKTTELSINDVYPKGEYSKRDRDLQTVLFYSKLLRSLPKNYQQYLK